MFEKRAAAFVREMEVRGIHTATATEAAEAGYVVCSIMGETMVMDCHYGLKISGLFSLDEFAAFLSGEKTPAKVPFGTPTYKNVRDLQELREIVNSPRHRHLIDKGIVCFRGQTRDYWMSRPVPNPRICDEQRKERIIVPSYWRRFLDKPLSERGDWGPSKSIFETILADPLIYHGIEGWRSLYKRNNERYGFHSISDFQDFPDHESQEYYRRWFKHKIQPRPEYPLVEQHYGQETIGLDITFDLATAAFFASHRWTQLKDSGKATYSPIAKGQHKGVIYLLCFRDPPVRRTDYLVKEIGVFEHLPVERPLRQQCGLPAFHGNEIAASARDLDAVIMLDANFDLSGLPEPSYLFPRMEDPFYLALLDEKQRYEDEWNWVVDYEF